MRFQVFDNGGSGHNSSFSKRYEDAVIPQDKPMNDSHISQLQTEWLLKHNPPSHIMNNPGAMAAWRQGAERKAREWAVQNEPKRFLNPLLRKINGISADSEMRRNRNGNTATISSSWVGDATIDATGRVLTIQLPPNSKNPTGKYTYGTTPQTLKAFLGAKSLGQVISRLRNSDAGTTDSGITKLWDSRKNPELRPKRRGNGLR